MNVAAPLDTVPPTPPRRHRLHRTLILAISGVTLAAAGFVAHYHSTGDAAATAGGAGQAQAAARATLAAFLAAGSTEERAALVIEGDKLLPLMQAWEASREAPALSAADFLAPSWTFNSQSSDLTALELPRDRGLPPIAACFKNAGQGKWLLDWEIWTQSLDGGFRNFIHRPAEGEQTLRARLTRSGTGDDMTVTVSDPFDARDTLTFDITRPDLRLLYSRDLPETGTRTATVQLVWLNDALSGTLKPDLRRHVCWGFPGLDGQSAEAVEVNFASKHRPPPGTPATPEAPEAPAAVLAAAPVIEAAIATALTPPTAGALPARPSGAAPHAETARK